MLKRWTTVLGFTLLYLAAAAAGAASSGNGEFLYYIGVMVVLMGAVGVLHLRVGLSPGALWGLSLWGILHMAGGLLPLPAGWPYDGPHGVFYSWWIVPGFLKYDMAVHAFGFGLTTWVCWQGYKAAVRGAGGAARPTFGALVLCSAGGMGFGALNEVVEFAATLLMRDTNVGGYANTGWDLVSNLTGCVLAALLIRLGGGRVPDPEA